MSSGTVELLPHDPAWLRVAKEESQALASAMGADLLAIHHIGSTAIAEIRAKPIVDLLAVVASVDALDSRQHDIEALGYVWRGEWGLPGRRYCVKSDAAIGRRLIHLHCFQEAAPEILGYLAFRDYLRTHPAVAMAYEHEKVRCRERAPDSRAYADCKDPWIKRTQAEALAWYQSLPPTAS